MAGTRVALAPAVEAVRHRMAGTRALLTQALPVAAQMAEWLVRMLEDPVALVPTGELLARDWEEKGALQVEKVALQAKAVPQVPAAARLVLIIVRNRLVRSTRIASCR